MLLEWIITSNGAGVNSLLRRRAGLDADTADILLDEFLLLEILELLKTAQMVEAGRIFFDRTYGADSDTSLTAGASIFDRLIS